MVTTVGGYDFNNPLSVSMKLKSLDFGGRMPTADVDRLNNQLADIWVDTIRPECLHRSMPGVRLGFYSVTNDSEYRRYKALLATFIPGKPVSFVNNVTGERRSHQDH